MRFEGGKRLNQRIKKERTMSDQPHPTDNGQPPAPGNPLVVLTITLTADGQINVNGPIHDMILSYGLLMRAHDAIKDYHANLARSVLTLPPGSRLRETH
jgi:hypothetical protein